jgi:hypothetical protein
MVRHLIRKPDYNNPDRTWYPSWRADTYTIICERTYTNQSGAFRTFSHTVEVSYLVVKGEGWRNVAIAAAHRLDHMATSGRHGVVFPQAMKMYLKDTEPGIPDDQRLPAERIEW